MRRLIPSDSPFVCSNERDSVYPHLIVQYGVGDRVRAGEIDIRARRSNRLIYHCNSDRIAMRINPDFAELASDARVLLVSGFNAMQDERLLNERLNAVLRILARLPEHATVYLEDGGYHNPSFRRLVLRRLGPALDVLGLNEDELQSGLKRRVNLSDADEVRRALGELHRRIGAGTFVLHTQHWALAHGAGASRYAAALKAGVTLATTRFRFGDDFSPANYRDIETAPPNEDGLRFAEVSNAAGGDRTFCVAAPAVEQANATTIGLGDAFVGGFLPALIQ